ncbi:MAG: ABC transporter permease [Roseibium sp.]
MAHNEKASISNAISLIWNQKKLLFNTVKADVRNQYAGTALGMIWVVLGPLTLLTLYSVIYALIFRVRVPNYTVEEYILNVFSGLVPFLAFSQALANSAGVMRRDQKLFFSSYPNLFIPIKTVLVSYVVLFVGVILVIIGDFAVSTPSWTLFLLPVVAFFQILFSIGLGMFVALFSLVLKDIEVFVQYVTIALLVITPIAYTPEMIPSGLKTLLYGNPLFYYVYASQHLILLNSLPPMEITIIGITLALVMFLGGLWFYNKAHRILNDLV